MMSTPLNPFEAPLKEVSLVEASAGTGKTYNISSLYVRAILQEGLSCSQILVMTFTEAATAELKFRLRNRLVDALKTIQDGENTGDAFLDELLVQHYENAEIKLKEAIDGFDEAAIFTIHGFCSRLLKEYSLQFGVSPNFELLTNEDEVLQDCVDEFWRNFVKQADTSDNDALLLDYLTENNFGPDELKAILDKTFNKPEAILVPKGMDADQLSLKVSLLKAKYRDIQTLATKEEGQLKEILLSGHLNKGSYKPENLKGYWDQFRSFLGSQDARMVVPEKLVNLGSKLYRSLNKGAPDYPKLDITTAIDEYLVLVEELKALKVWLIFRAYRDVEVQYKKYKKRRNVLSYNDLLTTVKDTIDKKGGQLIGDLLRARFPLALVDEFQDTDPIQYEIFRKLYPPEKGKSLFMIGDPKQAIYGFRGADIFTYLRAREHVSEGQVYELGNNFRSNEGMIKGVNALFDHADNAFILDGMSFRKAQFPSVKTDDDYVWDADGHKVSPLQCIEVGGDQKGTKGTAEKLIYEAVVQEVKVLLNGEHLVTDEDEHGHKFKRPVEEKDLAILVRKGKEGEEIQQRLRDAGFNSVLKSPRSVFNTTEADELFRILKAVHAVGYEPGLKAALATELLGYTAKDLRALQDQEKEWGLILEKMLRIQEDWNQYGIARAVNTLIREFEIEQRLAGRSDAERRITNLSHLIELLEKAEREDERYGNALMKWFHTKRNDESADSEDEQIRLESDEDLIQISTIHASKGLQYQIVLCPFLWTHKVTIKKGDIFSFQKDGEIYINISQKVEHPEKEEQKALAEMQTMAEDVRLTYVALTRAISACYIFLPDYNEIHYSSLASMLGGRGKAVKLSTSDISNKLKNIDHVLVRDPETPEDTETDEKDKGREEIALSSRSSSRTDLLNYPRMLSYSALTKHAAHPEEAHDYDAEYNPVSEAQVPNTKMGFPKGATAGTCLHMIFEEVSFSEPDDLRTIVSSNLEYYGFNKKWEQVVSDWVTICLSHDLNGNGIRLADLEEMAILKEMEFYFPVRDLNAEELWSMIRGEDPEEHDNDSLSGFMKGYIDLIFRHEGKYFILDYKSNYLGDDPKQYGSKELQEAIRDSGYDLQYHIYTLALHRFLKNRLEGYSYDDHFGGVFYIYLRGVEKGEPGSGVFTDRPSRALIEQMDAYMQRKEGS